MAQFASDPAFAASHEAPAAFSFKAKEGKTVVFALGNGSTGSGFFVPPSTGSSSAIVMIHEWWGLNDYIKQEAEKLHDELGCAVLAVDMYQGKVTSDPNEASRLMSGVPESYGRTVVRGAVAALTDGALDSAKKVGTIGWCFGGGWSDRAAIEGGPRFRRA